MQATSSLNGPIQFSPMPFPSIRTFYKRSPRLRRLSRRLKNTATYWLVRFGLAAAGALPLPSALRVAEWIGTLVYRVMPSLQRLSDEHLRIAFGETLSPAERQRIARQSVINVAKCFCEIAQLDSIVEHFDEWVTVDGTDVVESVLRRGRGAIVVTGHLGNWEILAAYFARKGLAITAVARRLYEDRINALLVSLRERHGVHTILREDSSSARQILQTLNRHEVLAMVIDQDTTAPSLSVPFFGRPARTPVAPATLALRKEIPLLAAFIERRPDGGHHITVHPPFAISETGTRLDKIRDLVTAMSGTIEAEVRQRPEEWVWWHKRWQRGPIPRLDYDQKFHYAEIVGSG